MLLTGTAHTQQLRTKRHQKARLGGAKQNGKRSKADDSEQEAVTILISQREQPS